MGSDWRIQLIDRELFQRELESFIPNRIFDVHAHLYETRHFNSELSELIGSGPETVGLETYKTHISEITPNRPTSGLFFPFPAPHLSFAGANDFLMNQVKQDSGSRAQMVIHPKMNPELIRETVKRDGFVGLKPYHVYAAERPTLKSPLPAFLPESHVRIAHEEELTITIHIVRPRAMADPANQEVIRRYAERYPKARLILAHAARGFNAYHTVMGIGALRGLRNIWCDTSAIAESCAFEAVLRTLGADRLMYGSDFPVSHERGRPVALGDSFYWIRAKDMDEAAYGQVLPTLVGIESLRALKIACMNLHLSDSQVEDIFYGNAARLFDLTEREDNEKAGARGQESGKNSSSWQWQERRSQGAEVGDQRKLKIEN